MSTLKAAKKQLKSPFKLPDSKRLCRKVTKQKCRIVTNC